MLRSVSVRFGWRSGGSHRSLVSGLDVIAACLASSGAAAQQYDPFGGIGTGGAQATNGQQQQNGQSPYGQSQQSQSTPYPVSDNRVGPTQIQDGSATGAALPANDGSQLVNGTVQDVGTSNSTGTAAGRLRQQQQQSPAVVAPPVLNEFEQFVQQRLGRPLPRFGANLIVPSTRNYSSPTTATVNYPRNLRAA